MKSLFCLIVSSFLFLGLSAQKTDLSKLSQEDRISYLTDLGRQAIDLFTEDMIGDDVAPVISEAIKFKFDEKKFGEELNRFDEKRNYYEVVFHDKSKGNNPPAKFTILVWEDDGQPFLINLGISINFEFVEERHPYSYYVKNGLPEIWPKYHYESHPDDYME